MVRQELLSGLEANRTYSFIGSSLLFIHDGTGLKRQRRPRIRMIDFAHVHTAEQDTAAPADPGYITGLQTLIRCDCVLEQSTGAQSSSVRFAREVSEGRSDPWRRELAPAVS